MNKFYRFAPMLAAMLAVTACQDYDLGLTVDEIKYKESFAAAFGKVDPNQNWDLYGQLAAGQNSMTRATTPAPLLGDVDVSDVPEDEYAVIYKEEAQRYTNMLPESESTTNTYEQTNLGRVVQNFKVKTSSFVVYPVHWCTTGNDVVGFYYHVPAGTTGAETITGIDGETYYIEKVQFYENKTHLEYTSGDPKQYDSWDNVPFSLLASYWDQLVAYNSSRYTESAGIKMINGTIEFSESNVSNVRSSEDLWSDLCIIASDVFSYGNGTIKFYWGYEVGPTEKAFLDSTRQPTWTNITDGNAAAVWGWGATALQSQGIKVTLPVSTEIGMYLTNGSYTFYSESNLNYKVNWGGSIGEKEACFVATYLDTDKDGNPVTDKNGTQIRYLCFEDWYGVPNFDLNDVVFRVYGFDGPGATVVDNDSYDEEAILVCEDLGNFDFDFNDVALKLAYHNGVTRTTVYKNDGTDAVDHVDVVETADVTVTAMAAGGANESTITLKGISSGDSHINGDGEIHKLLNGNAPSIINADETFGAEGKSVKINASELAAWNKPTYPTYLSQLFATGFVEITTQGGTVIKKTQGTAYSKGMADNPTMLLLPTSFEWPTENTLICDAYPGFKNWVNNADATDWINGKVSGKVTKR